MGDELGARNEFNRDQLKSVLPKRLLRQFQILLSSKDCLERWHWVVLTTMLDSIMRVCDDLGGTMDEKDSLPSASWNARNLLELWVWTEYCASKTNARVFYEDAFRDVAGIIEVSEKLSSSAGLEMPLVPPKQLLDEITARELGLPSIGSNFQKVVNAAKLVGFDAEYIAWNKLLSKFAHPTAYLVLQVMPNKRQMVKFQTENTSIGVYFCSQCAYRFEKIVAAIPPEKFKSL
jgi:hypothetical protein